MPIATLSSEDEDVVSAVEKAENTLQSAIIELETATGIRHLRDVVYDHQRDVQDRFAEIRQAVYAQRLRAAALAKLSDEEKTALGVRQETKG